MTDYNYQPLELPGILAHGWRLTLRTAIGAGLPALLLLFPIGMAMDHFGREFYSGMARLIELYGMPSVGDAPSEGFVREFMPLFGPMAAYYLLIFLYLVGIVYVQTITTRLSWESIAGHRPGIAEGVRGSFGREFWYNILQSLLLGTIAAMAFIALGIFREFGRTIAPMFEAIAMVVIFGAVVYFAVATIFRVHELVVDGRGPWHGVIASMALVRGHWWRVATVVIIIGLVGLLLTAILPGLAGPGPLFQSFTMTPPSASSGDNAEIMADMVQQYAASFTLLSSLIQRIMVPLVLLFAINLLTAKYVDLRVRRGDFEEEEEEISGDQEEEVRG